jgi:hypothetical protein
MAFSIDMATAKKIKTVAPTTSPPRNSGTAIEDVLNP